MEASIEKKGTVWDSLTNILFFSLSDKLKFSIKVSISMALSFLIPFAMGWPHASTAATTVMIIAAMGSVNESINKGVLRVLGTVIGAVIGITLIAVFPQDRMLYLIFLSVITTIILYLMRAYKGDPTILMLTAMVMFMVFKNGQVDDVFLYGVERTFLTVFGIVVYTLVGVFLWPVDIQDDSEESAAELSSVQSNLFLKRDAKKEEREALQEQLLAKEQLLENATMDVRTSSMDMNQWHSMIYNYKNISELLTLLAMHDKEDYTDNLPFYVTNYEKFEEDISILLKDISSVWKEKKEIDIPENIEPSYQVDTIKVLDHLERASMLTTIQNMQKLHKELRVLAQKLNSLNSSKPTFFTLEEIPENKRFLWGNIEHLKGALITFIIFWAAVYVWITFNPPGGFMVVLYSTILSVHTTFTPVKPLLLMIVFTISFILATFSYIFVLPNLHYGWELGLFIFAYSFICFYFVNPKMTIFFLLGLFIMGINNEMNYNFNTFLLTMSMFYIFLMLLNIFYYIPFSTKPEYLFLTMKKRFFRLSQFMALGARNVDQNKVSLWMKLSAKYSDVHLMHTVKQLQLWASKIDVGYFNTVDKDIMMNFTKECEKFAYLLELLYHRELKMKTNPLLEQLKTDDTLPSFADVLGEYASGKEVEDIDPLWKDEKVMAKKAEESLAQLLSGIDFNVYTKKEISELYENISLRRNVWLALFSCQTLMEQIDFKVLQRNRF